MKRGQVDTLIIIGGNPVYTAPADLRFDEQMNKVQMRVHLSLARERDVGGVSLADSRSALPRGVERRPRASTAPCRSCSRSSPRFMADGLRTKCSPP